MPGLDEVIKGLGEIMCFCHDKYNLVDHDGKEELTKMNQTAKDAITMLKNYDTVFQPLKPVLQGHMWECPVCHRPVGIFNDDEWFDYCPQCGKGMKWDALRDSE